MPRVLHGRASNSAGPPEISLFTTQTGYAIENREGELAGPFTCTCARCLLRRREDGLQVEVHIDLREIVKQRSDREGALKWAESRVLVGWLHLLIDLQVTADVEALHQAVTPP